jgi:hypothetical protein
MASARNDKLDALGEVCHIVAPNSLHHLFLPEWKRAYPSAKLYAPPGLREKRKDIEFEGDLGNAPIPDWIGEIDQALMRGNLNRGCVFSRRKWNGTLCRSDPTVSRQPTGSPAGELS